MDEYTIEVPISEVFGTGIESVEQTQTSTESGGTNEITVTLTNGDASQFYVRNGTSGGTPVPVETADLMTETSNAYLYLGSEEGYDYGYVYVYMNGVWTKTDQYGVGEDGFSPTATVTQNETGALISVTDKNGTTTAQIDNGQASDQQVADWLDNHPEATTTVQDGSITEAKLAQEVLDLINNGAISDDVKQALLDCFAHVAWVDEHGQDYYDALYDAFYPPAELVSISAVYTQSGNVYVTDTLDSLKDDLVVTALYDDSSTSVVTSYTLSGALTVGTSTITVTYEGKTDTFTVTVSDTQKDYTVGTLLHSYDFTQSLSDSVGSADITIPVGGTATRDSSGLHLVDNSSRALIPQGTIQAGHIIEIDVASTSAQFGNVLGRLLMWSTTNGLIYRYNVTWNIFGSNWSDNEAFSGNLSDKNAFNGHMCTVNLENYPKIYKDGLLMGTSTATLGTILSNQDQWLGTPSTKTEAFYTATITGMRIYDAPLGGE